MTGPETPEADAAEQARDAGPAAETTAFEDGGELDPGLEAGIADVLDQLTDADPHDDEVRDLH